MENEAKEFGILLWVLFDWFVLILFVWGFFVGLVLGFFGFVFVSS